MQRVLIVKTSSLGDVVHALPAVTDLSRARPELSIDWLVEESFGDIPHLHPSVSRVVPCALRRWRKRLLAARTWREIASLRRDLRQTHYDVVLDLQGLAKSAWLARMARGTRHSYNRSSIREPLASLAYDVRHAVSRELHAIERNRLLAGAAFGYAVSGPADYGLAFDQAPASISGKLICFHGTSRDDKLWAETHWRTVLTHYAEQGVRTLLPWGSDEERVRSDRLAAGIAGAEVPPRQSIAMLAQSCAYALGVIGVDTGLTHLAAAAGAPVIALYVGSDPGLTGVVGGRSPARNLGGRDAPPDARAVIEAAAELFARP